MLRGSVWRPEVEPCAAVVLLHGLGEHGRAPHHERLGRRLAAEGNVVLAFDLRGHGGSEGPRVFIHCWEDYRTDLEVVLVAAQLLVPDRPRFLVGLSMGALIAVDYASHYPDGLRGVVAAAAPLGATGSSRFMRLVVRVLSGLAPRLLLDPGLNPNDISRDDSARRAYLADPQVALKVTPRLAAALMDTAAGLRGQVRKWTTPVLLLHGGQDRMADPQGSRDFHAAVGSRDKALRIYPDARHNLLLEPEREEVASDIAAWIAARRD